MAKSKANTKHIPMRTCIAYGTKHPKNDLIRLVVSPAGKINPDLKGKLKGRGANISPDINALEVALKKKSLQRALKLEKALSQEEQNELMTKFKLAIEEKVFRPNNKPVTIKIKKDMLQKSEDGE